MRVNLMNFSAAAATTRKAGRRSGRFRANAAVLCM